MASYLAEMCKLMASYLAEMCKLMASYLAEMCKLMASYLAEMCKLMACFQAVSVSACVNWWRIVKLKCAVQYHEYVILLALRMCDLVTVWVWHVTKLWEVWVYEMVYCHIFFIYIYIMMKTRQRLKRMLILIRQCNACANVQWKHIFQAANTKYPNK